MADFDKELSELFEQDDSDVYTQESVKETTALHALDECWPEPHPDIDDKQLERFEFYSKRLPKSFLYAISQEDMRTVMEANKHLLFVSYLQRRTHSYIPWFILREHIVEANYDDQGLLHSENGQPALVYRSYSPEDSYGKSSVTETKIWLEHGQFVSSKTPNYVSDGIMHDDATSIKPYHKWLKTQTMTIDGYDVNVALFHREGGPAFEYTLDIEGDVTLTKEWFINGYPSRESGLYTKEVYDSQGTLLEATRDDFAELSDKKEICPRIMSIRTHSVDDKPAYFFYTLSNTIDGRLLPYRLGSITLSDFTPGVEDVIWSSRQHTWYFQGKPHRDNDLPATIERLEKVFPDGKVEPGEIQRFYYHGQLHRLSGPAEITIKEGEVIKRQWFFFGEELTKEEHSQKVAEWVAANQ